MPINPEAVGTLSDPQVTSWTSKDSLLYAVGVGAGQDPTDKRDLPFVTENSNGVKQAAYFRHRRSPWSTSPRRL